MRATTVLLPAILLILCIGCSSFHSDFVLVKDGNAEVEIIENSQAAEAQKILVSEAAKCGVKLDLTSSEKGGNRIVFEVEDRPIETEDAFTIDFPDSRTMKIRCSPVSARWAVNHLLETAFGVRWFFPHNPAFGNDEANDYPSAVHVAVKRKKYIQKPYSFYLHRSIDWRDLRFAANWGAKYPFMAGHFMPVDVFPVWKYAPDQSWPKEVMPVLKGKRYIPPKPKTLPLPQNPYLAKIGYDAEWNPCFTDPRTAEIAIENILEILEKDPKKRDISMGVNDNGGMCECEKCRNAVGGKRNSGGYADYSEPYWKWVNTVAETVSKKHPDVWFVCLAYREVMDPPFFKLHPKVIVRPCFEIYAMREPTVRERRLKIMKKWSACCPNILFYDYYSGLGAFLFPRIHFRHQASVLKEFYEKYNLRGLFQEAAFSHAFEGPKFYQMYRLMRDIGTDPEDPVAEWCRNAVGEEAAPVLRKYYQFWEDYWMGEDIRKTAWYINSVNNIYMQLGERSSHTFALKRGDMRKLRALMTEVVEKAENPQQKRRANILMKYFEYAEDAAQALFSELIPPEGRLRSAEDAAELLRQVPAAVKAEERFRNHPFNTQKHNLTSSMMMNIGLIQPFIREPSVRDELAKLEKEEKLPAVLRAQIKIWLGADVTNRIENGSFEQEKLPIEPLWSETLHGSRDTKYASDGIYAFKTRNGYYLTCPKIEQGKTYMLVSDLFIEQGSSEGRFSYRLDPSLGRTSKHVIQQEFVLTGGRWNTCSAVISHPGPVDNLKIMFFFQKFESDEPVWIDNIRFYCLDDLIQSGPTVSTPEK